MRVERSKEDTPAGQRVCSTCGIEKRIPEDFYRQGNLPDGLIRYETRCKACSQIAKAASYRKKHPPKERANARKTFELPTKKGQAPIQSRGLAGIRP
jgi:hypothetical protein